MRWLAFGLCGALSACSLIYNPNNLPSPPLVDAMPDAELIFDADPTMLQVTSVSPAVLDEGQGDHCRPAVITISGHHMVKDGASIAIAVHTGQAKTTTIDVDNTKLDVAADGDMIAVPVSIPVDPNLGSTDKLELDVTLTQNTPNGPISKTVSGLSVQGHAELSGNPDATITPVNPVPLYSKVDVPGKLIAGGDGSQPIIVRAVTTARVGGTTSFDGSTTAGGPAGGTGGAGGMGNLVGNGQAGMMGTGPAGGASGGGGGGWIGNDQITTLGAPNRSSGGGGGNGGGTLAGAGGAGGGGGGSVEVSAGGDVMIGKLTANGAPGVAGGGGVAGPGGPGGGGSGGVVLLRSGTGNVTIATDVTASGGAGPGSHGMPGRIRIDAPGTISAITAVHFRGPTFAASTPMIVREESPILTVIGEPGRNILYYANNGDGTESHGPQSVLVPPNGTVMFKLALPLFRGTNTLCAIVEGANAGTAEAGHCITISYLYTP